MDKQYELNGLSFIWDERKERINVAKHGITFATAAEVWFDFTARYADAHNHDDDNVAIVGYPFTGTRQLFVVHAELEGDLIRIISARKATPHD